MNRKTITNTDHPFHHLRSGSSASLGHAMSHSTPLMPSLLSGFVHSIRREKCDCKPQMSFSLLSAKPNPYYPLVSPRIFLALLLLYCFAPFNAFISLLLVSVRSFDRSESLLFHNLDAYFLPSLQSHN